MEYLLSSSRTASHPSPRHHPSRLKKKFFEPSCLFLLISSSAVHLEADEMDLAFRVKFKYICIILHDYCVIIGVVVVPREASLSSPSIGAFGRFPALRALSRGALGSSQALSSPPPAPASPSSPPSSSSFSAPPPRPLSSALAGSQARVSRQGGVAATGGARGAGART